MQINGKTCCLYRNAHGKLKKLPVEDYSVSEQQESEQSAPAYTDIPDSAPLRIADMTAKSRTLLEYSINGHKILYRRVKRTNELVIDGYVYGEYIARLEMPHVLTAYVDGHDIAVGYNGSASYAVIDGQQVASKIRWY